MRWAVRALPSIRDPHVEGGVQAVNSEESIPVIHPVEDRGEGAVVVVI